jgi:hypothetical protein
VLVVALGAALTAWTAGWLDLTPSLGLRASVLLAVFLVPWGWLLSRAVDRSLLSPPERVVLALLLGYPIGATAYYLLARLQAAVAFAPLSLALATLLFLRARRRDDTAAGHAAPVDGASLVAAPLALALVVPLVLFTLTRWNRALVPLDGALAYDHSTDHSLHLAFYWELLRGVPAREIPAAAGVPFPSYHFLSFMPGLWLIRGGLPMVTAYHAVCPLLKLSLLMAAVYLAVRIRTRDGRTATAAVLAVFLVDYAFELRFNERMVVGPPPHYDVIRNEAEGGGLVVWAVVAVLLALHDRARASATPASRGGQGGAMLMAAGLLAGLSYAFKAQVFLLFGAAFGLALALLFLRDRSRALLLGLASMALAFAVVFALSRTGAKLASMEWRAGSFADLYIYPNLRRDPSRALDAGLLRAFESVPAGLGFLIAVPFAIWRIVAFSPLVPAYVVDVLRRARSAGLSDLLFALAFLLALPMGYGLSVASIYAEPSPFEFRQAAHGLALLGAAVSVAALHAILQRRGGDAGRWVLVAAVAASVAVAPFLARAGPYVPAGAGIVLGPDEQCALLFLRHHAPVDAVVASVRTASFADVRRGSIRLNPHAVVAGFAGRRSVLEFYGKEVDGRNDRERDLRRLFTTRDERVADQVLDRYHVDYVLESDTLPLAFPKRRLEEIYRRASWRVYRVPRADRPSGPPAADWPVARETSGDLACSPAP